MSKKIILLTGNERKKKSFEQAIIGYDIEAEIQKPWIPEIQSEDSGEIAAYSAKYGSNLLNKPVIKMDSGFFIDGLNGFPGPFVSYVDKQIGADLFFNILKKLKNRKARIKNSLAYCEPGKEPKIFESGCNGRITKSLLLDKGSFIDRLFIPNHPFNPKKKLMGIIRNENYDKFLKIWGDAEIQFARWFHNLPK